MTGFLTFLQVSGPDWLWTLADATVKGAALLGGAGLLVASAPSISLPQARQIDRTRKVLKNAGLEGLDAVSEFEQA